MSLDLLKERLNVKPQVSETEMELEHKRKLVEELQNESVNLKNQLSILQNDNDNLIYEVNKFRKNEESMVLLKEEEFNNKLQNKNLHITNLKLDINSLYEQMDIKDKKIDYKNKMINDSIDAVKEAKIRIDNLKNELKLNENKSSKITKKLELQIEENYNEYMYNLKSLQNSVIDNNKVIDDKKQKLENSLKEIKKLTKNIDNLQKKNKKDEKRIKELNNKIRESSNSFILENNTFKKKLSEKDEHIYKLRTEVEDLTDKLRLIENMRYKNEEFDENNPNVQSLIELLKNVSKEKQKMQVMDWNQWKEIPENRYLIELSMKQAEKIFKDNNENAVPFEYKEKFRSGRRNEYLPIKEVNRRAAVASIKTASDLQSEILLLRTATAGTGIMGPDTTDVNDLYLTGTWSHSPFAGNASTPAKNPVSAVSDIYDVGPNFKHTGKAHKLGGGGNNRATLFTDSDGVDFFNFQDKDPSAANDAIMAESAIDADGALSDAEFQASVARTNIFDSSYAKTLVYTVSFPSLDLEGNNNISSSGTANSGVGGQMNYLGFSENNSDGIGDDQRWGTLFHGYDGNGSAYVHAKNADGDSLDYVQKLTTDEASGPANDDGNLALFNRMVVVWDARNKIKNQQVIRTAQLDPDKKYIVFFRMDRPNNQWSLTLGNTPPSLSFEGVRTHNGTYGTGNTDGADVGSTVNTSVNGVDSGDMLEYLQSYNDTFPEWHLYDMRIYDKILSDDEQVAVATQLANTYKVDL